MKYKPVDKQYSDVRSLEKSSRLWGSWWRAEQRAGPYCPRLDLLMGVRERTGRCWAAVKVVFDGAKCADAGG